MTTRAIPSWFSVSPTTGNGNQIVNVTAEENTDIDAREADLEISGQGVSKVFNVNQEPSPGELLTNYQVNFTTLLPLEGTSGGDFSVILLVKDVTGEWKSKRVTASPGTYPSGAAINVKIDSTDEIYVNFPCYVRIQILPVIVTSTEDIQVMTVQGINAPVDGWKLYPVAVENAFTRTVMGTNNTITRFESKGGATSFFNTIIFEAQITKASGFVCNLG